MALRFLAVTAAAVAIVCIAASGSRGAVEAVPSKVSCDKYVSLSGSNSFSGTLTKPYLTVEKLASSLRNGQTGCLRAGVYRRNVEITRGGSQSAPITISSFPGERATIQGRLHIADSANNVVVQELDLDGRNSSSLPSPTVNGDNAVFRDNDITNAHTTICFLLGSKEWGRARGTVIERNRIHNCGELPPTNHHHGIYVEASDNARIIGNWIYDNADRGVQLFPDAQGTYVARNVIDGNGQGVVFSRQSANNVVENNVLSNPLVRYNLESYDTTGKGNLARRNCLWSTRHWGYAGVQLDIAVSVVENFVSEPGYASRTGKDFRLPPTSPCMNFPGTATMPRAAAVQPSTRPGRRLRLRAAPQALWPGSRLRLRAELVSPEAGAAAPNHAVLRLHRAGTWWRVGLMQRRGDAYVTSVRLVTRGRKRARRLGRIRLPRGPRMLRLRAYVPGAGRSNIVTVHVTR